MVMCNKSLEKFWASWHEKTYAKSQDNLRKSSDSNERVYAKFLSILCLLMTMALDYLKYVLYELADHVVIADIFDFIATFFDLLKL